MSATTSATTARRYGLERVCRTWERSRSAFYARRARVRRPERGDGPGRRGPTPALSEAQLLATQRPGPLPVPGRGPSHGPARLRILDRIRVSRTRVLRVMRAHGLLSPHRGRQGDPKAHDGTIVTSAPQVMWGTDGVRVFTAEDGWVWTFAAVDHWNAECVGWHVAAALEPIGKGSGDSTLGRGGRGAAWRYGWTTAASICQTTSSTSLLGHPPQLRPAGTGNQRGVERWNRTLKEQAISAGSFTTSPKCAAVAAFVERYNQCWRLEALLSHATEAREECYVKPRSANVCPRNRVRYTERLARTMAGGFQLTDSALDFLWQSAGGLPKQSSLRIPRQSAPPTPAPPREPARWLAPPPGP